MAINLLLTYNFGLKNKSVKKKKLYMKSHTIQVRGVINKNMINIEFRMVQNMPKGGDSPSSHSC